MRLVLARAGLDNVRLSLITGVCDACREYRARDKPGHAAMPSTALPGKVNEEVECGLMFYTHKHKMRQIIDCCMRYATGMEVSVKTMTSILDAYQQCWIQFGPAK
eukprot:9190771-Pyramimonas_sp.AAC.1